ncbi:MAG: hypothetical protein A2087_09825 [Spirochaetes bacterium GWD1_61_31]|nr:MAG: hypothetical protein A2Y37_07460 [Spirochaetes bacterium GWB1_60_80]OHD34674.1 MAG: hypothetical protein A2004_01370 [Spirochaetes bacterium GWC1_61_12]OHD34960.1 MAG: hypothetical protein A2087_09825 [Spirochaetes bacterium GWD1_61_31]OHD42428.1 MAG: hypothetical protein A2Y35_06245 [Spirochaetes bacterium GWE1_60_18]OHD59231.1 MAG: hypothetical protein A2Y32_00425 [Spirochaetes bacterium GWF1_60_12]HAP43067.1 hypothetical protein [Spirochaetaceae bacterium]
MPSGPLIANRLCQPSYLSERWALSWYGLLPEKVNLLTSVTPRGTCDYSNEFGAFRYRCIQ